MLLTMRTKKIRKRLKTPDQLQILMLTRMVGYNKLVEIPTATGHSCLWTKLTNLRTKMLGL